MAVTYHIGAPRRTVGTDSDIMRIRSGQLFPGFVLTLDQTTRVGKHTSTSSPVRGASSSRVKTDFQIIRAREGRLPKDGIGLQRFDLQGLKMSTGVSPAVQPNESCGAVKVVQAE